jgi:hypothetical protein
MEPTTVESHPSPVIITMGASPRDSGCSLLRPRAGEAQTAHGRATNERSGRVARSELRCGIFMSAALVIALLQADHRVRRRHLAEPVDHAKEAEALTYPRTLAGGSVQTPGRTGGERMRLERAILMVALPMRGALRGSGLALSTNYALVGPPSRTKPRLRGTSR